jgi:hypothetical protein
VVWVIDGESSGQAAAWRANDAQFRERSGRLSCEMGVVLKIRSPQPVSFKGWKNGVQPVSDSGTLTRAEASREQCNVFLVFGFDRMSLAMARARIQTKCF